VYEEKQLLSTGKPVFPTPNMVYQNLQPQNMLKENRHSPTAVSET
jgi:hypothetical protein